MAGREASLAESILRVPPPPAAPRPRCFLLFAFCFCFLLFAFAFAFWGSVVLFAFWKAAVLFAFCFLGGRGAFCFLLFGCPRWFGLFAFSFPFNLLSRLRGFIGSMHDWHTVCMIMHAGKAQKCF